MMPIKLVQWKAGKTDLRICSSRADADCWNGVCGDIDSSGKTSDPLGVGTSLLRGNSKLLWTGTKFVLKCMPNVITLHCTHGRNV